MTIPDVGYNKTWRPGKKIREVKGPKPKQQTKVNVKDLVLSEEGIDSVRLLGALHSTARKNRAQYTQQLMDFGFCLRPYIHEYFSDVENLLSETPMFLQERFIIASFLGLQSEDDLVYEYLVKSKVKYWLNREKLPYAVHLCRMAKDKGSSGMIEVFKYMKQNLDKKLAYRVLQNMKEWGCVPEGPALDFMVQQEKPLLGLLNPENAKLKTICEKALAEARDDRSKLTALFSVLQVMSKTSTLRDTFDFFSQIPNSGPVARDHNMYRFMFDYLASFPPYKEDLMKFRDYIWRELKTSVKSGAIIMTPELVNAHLQVLVTQPSEAAYQSVLSVIDNYFSKNMPIETDEFRFPFESAQFDLLLKSMLETRNSADASMIFRELKNYPHVKLTLENCHGVLRNIIMQEKPDYQTAEVVLRNMQRFEDVNSVSIYLAMRALKFRKTFQFESDLVDTIFTKDVQVDSLLIAGYAEYVFDTYSSNRKESSNHGMRVLEMAQKHIDTLKHDVFLKRNPYILQRGLSKLNELSTFIRFHPDFRALGADPVPSWIPNFQQEVLKLLQEADRTVKDAEAKYRSKSVAFNSFLEEVDIWHERQKLISQKLRRRIEYHEIHINKPTIKHSKERLRQLLKRTLVPQPVPRLDFVEHHLP